MHSAIYPLFPPSVFSRIHLRFNSLPHPCSSVVEFLSPLRPPAPSAVQKGFDTEKTESH